MKRSISGVFESSQVSAESGDFSRVSGGSATILVTARTLAEAARRENLRVWCFTDEPSPYGQSNGPASGKR
jgi:hypothetical protein